MRIKQLSLSEMQHSVETVAEYTLMHPCVTKYSEVFAMLIVHAKS